MQDDEDVPGRRAMPENTETINHPIWSGIGADVYTVQNTFVRNPIIEKTHPIDCVHVPWLEAGAYESLWLQPNASFAKMSKLLGAEYKTLPLKHVEWDVAEQAMYKIYDHFDNAKVHGVEIVVRRDHRYPARLLDAKHPIQLFYYQGVLENLYTRCVAVIGSRNPSREGIKRAVRIARELAKSGFTVVSGLAKGIDTAALESAMDCGGKVIAVIGTPLTSVYPKENRDLQVRISKEHLLISQVPLLLYETQTYKENRMFFPERNATMSALSEASLIVEAGNKSGALTQARHAFYQKRKVLVLDSCFKDSSLIWPAKLEAQGAIRIRSSDDLIKALGVLPLYSPEDALMHHTDIPQDDRMMVINLP